MRTYYSLYSCLPSEQVSYDDFRQVKRNKGAAEIDGQIALDIQ